MISRAEVPFVAFARQKKAEQVPGRLVVRRIPGLNAEAHRAAGHDTLFDLWRFPAFFSTAAPDTLDTVAADKTHRGHAIIEQVHADLKSSALAHPPSGVFTATPPGSCSRSSRSTSPEQPAPSPPQNGPGRQLRPCDATRRGPRLAGCVLIEVHDEWRVSDRRWLGR